MQFWDMFAVELQATCNLGICLQLNCKCGAKKERLKSEWAHLVACAWDVWRVIAGLLRGNDDENKCVARGFGVDIEP